MSKSKERCLYSKFFKTIDQFGKKPRFYYNKNEEKNTLIGGIITILYIFVLTAFTIYKLNRLIERKDVKFYDSFDYINKSSINLTIDNFYGGFGLEDPETYDPFIDETIYYPKAYFKKAERLNDDWNWTVHEVELERCKIEKFGKFFKNDFSSKGVSNLYCFKEMNETFIGHFSADLYSFFFIELYPCKNTTENNNHCKPIEEINYYLNGTFVCMEFQDVELNPQNYSFPIRSRNQDIYFTVGKKLFKEVHIFYQIVKVDTDLEKLGMDTFEEFKNSKEKNFLKYYSTYIMDNIIESDIYEEHQPFCSITMKLYDQIRIQKREYNKIFDIIGDVGGFKEIFEIFLKLLLYIPLNISYNLDIVNKLFQFEIAQKTNRKIKIKALQKIVDFQTNVSFKKKKKKKNSRNLSKETDVSNETKIIENGGGKSNSNIDKESIESNIKSEEIWITNIKSYKPYINYLCYIFTKEKSNLEIKFINEGMNLFIENMDIFNIFKIAMKNKSANKEKQEEFMRDYFIKHSLFSNT